MAVCSLQVTQFSYQLRGAVIQYKGISRNFVALEESLSHHLVASWRKAEGEGGAQACCGVSSSFFYFGRLVTARISVFCICYELLVLPLIRFKLTALTFTFSRCGDESRQRDECLLKLFRDISSYRKYSY